MQSHRKLTEPADAVNLPIASIGLRPSSRYNRSRFTSTACGSSPTLDFSSMRFRAFVAGLALMGSGSRSLARPRPQMPVDEVRPGMVGIGRTVFDGDTVEEFKVHILGVLRNVIGPQPQPDPGAARRRSARPHRRHRRHERQPGLHRRPAVGAVSYSLGNFSQGADRRHHADRRDDRRDRDTSAPRAVTVRAQLDLPITPARWPRP